MTTYDLETIAAALGDALELLDHFDTESDAHRERWIERYRELDQRVEQLRFGETKLVKTTDLA